VSKRVGPKHTAALNDDSRASTAMHATFCTICSFVGRTLREIAFGIAFGVPFFTHSWSFLRSSMSFSFIDGKSSPLPPTTSPLYTH